MIGLVNSKKFHRTCFLCATFLLRQKKCGKTTLFCHQRSGAQKINVIYYFVYFGYVLLFLCLAYSKKKKVRKKKKSTLPIRICKNFSAQIFRHKTLKFASGIQQFYVTNQQLRCDYALYAHTSQGLVNVCFANNALTGHDELEEF